MRTREEIIWAAGLFEGEGCFTARRGEPGTAPKAQLAMTDKDVVLRFWDAIGFGNVCGPYAQAGRKPKWVWTAGSFEEFQAVGAMFWPWLGARRQARFKELVLARRYRGLRASFLRHMYPGKTRRQLTPEEFKAYNRAAWARKKARKSEEIGALP